MNLEDKIRALFSEVKTKYYMPPISGPRLIKEHVNESGEGTALLNWINYSIAVNIPFIQIISKNRDFEKVTSGIFEHEFGHYFFHPRNLTLNLYLSYRAHKEFKDKASSIYPLYTDFQNNILIVRNGFGDNLKETLKGTWETSKKTPLDVAYYGAYNDILDLKLKIPLKNYENKKEIRAAINTLKRVVVTDNQDYGLQFSQLSKFGDAIKNLIDDGYQHSQCKGGEMITPEDIRKLPPGSRSEAEGAIRKLIKKLPRGLYEDIKGHYLGEDKSKKSSEDNSGIGSAGVDLQVADMTTVDYYRDAAKEFGLYIRPKRMLSLSAVDLAFSKREFKPTDPPHNIDMTFSGGKMLPGLTRTTRFEKIPYPTEKDSVPRLILYKDASGSMINPAEGKCYGTIAGAIEVLSYLRSGAEVGVAVFDTTTTEIKYTRNENKCLEILTGYKGGGTDVNIDTLRRDLNSRSDMLPRSIALNPDELKQNPFFKKYLTKNANINTNNVKFDSITDFVIITDGGIGNMRELVAFFEANPQYRPTILHTSGFDLDIPGYDQETSGIYTGISVQRAVTREDIIEMTRKSLRDTLLS